MAIVLSGTRVVRGFLATYIHCGVPGGTAAYYLVTEVSFGEGFGVATSPDGTHWTDHGYVWHGPSWWNNTKGKWWEGSSAIWRAADYNTTGRYRRLSPPFVP